VHTKDLIDIAAYACALAAAITVGRNNLKKQTIADQAAFITALEKKVLLLERQNEEQGKRISCLEGKLNGDAGLVEGRPVAHGHGTGSGYSAALAPPTSHRSHR